MDYAHSHRTDLYEPALPPAPRLAPAPPPPPALSRDEAWALVAPYRARLIAVARSRGLSLPDAQDVAHHVLCRAVERGCIDPQRVGAYLVKAAVNRCHDVAEEAVKQARLLARTRGDDRLAARVDEVVCDRAHVEWLLGHLPERERRVVLLSVCGETVTGIAAATGLSYPTVDRLLSRARKELRRLAGALGVVGAAAWRQRKLATPSATTAAVALAGVSALTLHSPVPPTVAPAARQETRAVPVRPAPPAAAARPVAVRAAVPVAALAMRAQAAAPAPPAAAEGGDPVAAVTPDAKVKTNTDGLVERLQKCVDNGVDIAVSSRGGVICRETVSTYIAGTVPLGRT